MKLTQQEYALLVESLKISKSVWAMGEVGRVIKADEDGAIILPFKELDFPTTMEIEKCLEFFYHLLLEAGIRSADDLAIVAALCKRIDERYGYICYYNGKEIQVYAKSVLSARAKAAVAGKVPLKNMHKIDVHLAERDGEPVIHTADF